MKPIPGAGEPGETVDQRVAELVDRARERRATTKAIRAQLAERRSHGLRARHHAKEQQMTRTAPRHIYVQTARRPGRCPRCHQPITPGERVAQLNPDAAWLHTECLKQEIHMKLSQRQGELIAEAVRRILTELDATREQLARLPEVAPRVLRQIDREENERMKTHEGSP